MKQKPTELKGEIDKSTIIIGGFNTLLSVMTGQIDKKNT